MTDKEFLNAKRLALKKYFSNLNSMQQEAVFTVNGPLLILAGAGSGKTTVLVNRVANMIYFGNAYMDETRSFGVTASDERFLLDYAAGISSDSERLKSVVAVDCVNPWSILAITFTNKAAQELKTRLNLMLGSRADGITAATFHSACVRILRREIENLGYASNFTIYDTDDSTRVIKSCLEELNISDKLFAPKMILNEISHSKESRISAEEYAAQNINDYRKKKIGDVYTAYQKRLRTANAVDFDDILLLTVQLFENFPDVLDHYQNLYKYILVDEYQDTNMVQYRLVSLLSQKRRNLCVVGDDDQSIYKFRGATIENILSFEHQFENAKVIRLEQNYRSTQAILNCANEVIKNNHGRKGKNLWTSGDEGDKVTIYRAANEQGEARFVAQTIYDSVKNGGKWGDNAVLYRMNAQSNAIERALVASGISYRVIGGVKFYERKEIKDMIAYLSVLNNESDILRLRRIINEPKRGIGEQSVNMLESVALGLGDTPFAIMRNASDYPLLSRNAGKFIEFAKTMDELKEISESEPLDLLLDQLIEKTGYRAMLQAMGDEGAVRLENIEELKSTMVSYMQNAEEPSLSGFLEEIALYTDIDSLDSNADAVTLMTVHAAKGLEFTNVFVVGMEENIFPSSRSIDIEDDLEEERRLCYVAITRARKKLYICCARQRMLFGTTQYNKPSRFVGELPKEFCLDKSEKETYSHNDGAAKSSYSNRTLSQRSGFGTAAKSSESVTGVSSAGFSAGDRVSHNIFGEGTVKKATKMSNDMLLEIEFDRVGTKKIMANFAKIRKL